MSGIDGPNQGIERLKSTRADMAVCHRFLLRNCIRMNFTGSSRPRAARAIAGSLRRALLQLLDLSRVRTSSVARLPVRQVGRHVIAEQHTWQTVAQGD